MKGMPLGIYISVPFCRTKCSYCNFASDVFSRTAFDRYVDRVCGDIASARRTAAEMGGQMERAVDSVYLGGGTPTVLEPRQLAPIFAQVREEFNVEPTAEITIECAPGTLSDSALETFLRCGVNRVSLGVQSFVDEETAAVGRLHKRNTVFTEIERLRASGITNINIDLIAGLPHQTTESWNFSIEQTLATGVPHVSVYMLEIDEDSRLGRELIAGGTRYHAHFVPDEDVVADFYIAACDRLSFAGIAQYEISNLAREGFESRHNLKYWTRQPYLGFGVDAHSMLPSVTPELDAVRFSTTDELEKFAGGAPLQQIEVSPRAALEENLFLGLRLNRGVNLPALRTRFGDEGVDHVQSTITKVIQDGLMEERNECVRLTPLGRLLSNEVFQRFVTTEAIAI
jgi:oxygen-independent coproporphyrinogen III oxidase